MEILSAGGVICAFFVDDVSISWQETVNSVVCVDASKYRYGFNGKENDNEVKGQGNQQDYGMRIYDNRLGRFLSVDPIGASFPYYTPYQFAGNKPIKCIDLDGLEEIVPLPLGEGSLIQVKKAPEVIIVTLVQVSKITIGAQVSEGISGVESFSLIPFAFTIGSVTTTTVFNVTEGTYVQKVEYDYPFNGLGLEVTNKISGSFNGIELSAEQSFVTNPSGYGHQKDKYKSEAGISVPFISKGDKQAGVNTTTTWEDGQLNTETTISTSCEAACILGVEQTFDLSIQVITTPPPPTLTMPPDSPMPTIQNLTVED